MKVAFLADENFNGDILRGLIRRGLNFNIVRVQDVGLGGATDPEILEWAAQAGRVVLTHDVKTMTKYAYDRVRRGDRMPGLIEASRLVPINQAIDDLLLIAEFSAAAEWENRVIHLPLR